MIKLNGACACVLCALARLFITRFRLYLFFIVFPIFLLLLLLHIISWKCVTHSCSKSPSDSLMRSFDHIQQMKIMLYLYTLWLLLYFLKILCSCLVFFFFFRGGGGGDKLSTGRFSNFHWICCAIHFNVIENSEKTL